jgi:hypothetical protein
MDDEHPDVHYSDSFEKMLAKNGEQFLCLSKAHDSAQRWTATWHTYLTIPVIILSGLSGLGAVGSETLLPFHGSTTLVGLVSFTCATLQTISSYFSFSSRAANHRNAATQYAKLHALISFELSLPRPERMSADKLLELIKDESSRLLESAPQFPVAVKKEFTANYKDTLVSVPAVLNGLEPIEVVVSPPPRQSQPSLTPTAALPETARPIVRVLV